MLNDFDNAVLNHIKRIFPNTYYANTAVVYNVAYSLADVETLGFKLKFPLVSIYRPSGFDLVADQTFPSRRLGQGIGAFSTNKETKARFLTANLAYQIDIYAKSQEQLNQLTEEIIKYLNFEPKVEVDQSQGDNVYIESYDITYNNGPNELSEFTNDDRVYHYAIVYDIKNARLVDFSRDLPTITKVDFGEDENDPTTKLIVKGKNKKEYNINEEFK